MQTLIAYLIRKIHYGFPANYNVCKYSIKFSLFSAAVVGLPISSLNPIEHLTLSAVITGKL